MIRNHMTIIKIEKRDHSFRTFPKFSEKMTYMCVSAVRDVCFLESFTYVLNERSPNERLFVDRAIDRINSFLDTVSILYLLKTPENLKFSGVNREYKIRILAGNGLNISFTKEFLKKHFLKN